MNVKTTKLSKNLQNSIWNVLEVLLTPIIFFITIPIFLSHLGPKDYGIWMLVNSIIVMMQAFNLGLNTSTYKYISEAIVGNSTQRIKDTLNTNISLTILIFLFAVLLCILLSWGVNQFNWFLDDIEDSSDLILCLFGGMGILFTKLAEQILYTVYRSYENFKYVTLLTISIKIATVTGNIWLASYTKSIVNIFYFTLFINFIGLYINYKMVTKFVPSYSYNWLLKKELIKHEIRYSLYVWIQSIAVIIAFQADRLLVSFQFGVVVLAYYSIAATLFNHIHMAFGAVLAWLFPQIIKNKSSKKVIYDQYQNSRNILIVSSVILLSLFCLFTELIFSVWLGFNSYPEIETYLKWFSIFEFIFVFSIAPHFFLNAADQERFSLILVSIFSSLVVLGMLLSIQFVNTPNALVISLPISVFIGMFILHYSIDRKFIKRKNGLSSTFLLFIPSLIGCGIAYFDDYTLKLTLFALSLIALYFIYIKQLKTNFKLLFND